MEVFFMPRGDRTGPAGFGPMTGRGAGFCAGNNAPGYMNPYGGYGMGRGRGRGFGRMGYGYGSGWGRFGGYAYPNPPVYPDNVDDKAMMADQVNFLEEQLKQARKQLDELEKKSDK
jgi:hypothetical protein